MSVQTRRLLVSQVTRGWLIAPVVALALAAMWLAISVLTATAETEDVKLTASDSAGFDSFGFSVSISGDRAIVGAIGDDDEGFLTGSAYVFERDVTTGTWSQTQKLTASDGAAGDSFGFSVSISGDRAIVGAELDADKGTTSGSAYVYERDATTGIWSEAQKLTASDGAAQDFFGRSVSISGDRAIVGSFGNDDNGFFSGSAYVFERDPTTGFWSEAQKLTASDGAAFDLFGRSVSMSGDRAIVGALRHNDKGSASGSAYVFDRDATTGIWSEAQKLTASDGAAGDVFGFSVSISGDRAIVGASRDEDKGFFAGSAYVFERDATTGIWSEAQKLTASDGAANDVFGFSVSISGDRAIVAAIGDEDKGLLTGSAYVFERDATTGTWSQTQKLTASDGAAGDVFGFSVSISGDRAIVGATGDDNKAASDGSAYVYELSNQPPIADAGPDQDVVVGNTAQLDGSGSSDPDGDPITFSWTLISQPAESTSTLANASTFNPTLSPGVAGIYKIELVVNDGQLDSSPNAVLVTAITPQDAVEDLIGEVVNLGLPSGTETSLTSKLSNAEGALSDMNENNDGSAINKIQAFINEVNAQRGVSLTDAQADELVGAAQAIIDALSGT